MAAIARRTTPDPLSVPTGQADWFLNEWLKVARARRSGATHQNTQADRLIPMDVKTTATDTRQVAGGPDLDALELLALAATQGRWALWTSCSWRRYGVAGTSQTVCEPTTHHIDGHPDLAFNNDADRLWIEAAHPAAILPLIAQSRRLAALAPVLDRLAQTWATDDNGGESHLAVEALLDAWKNSLR